MLQHLQLLLEEGRVEQSVAIGSDLNEFCDKEGRITILIFTHTILIPAE